MAYLSLRSLELYRQAIFNRRVDYKKGAAQCDRGPCLLLGGYGAGPHKISYASVDALKASRVKKTGCSCVISKTNESTPHPPRKDDL